MDNNLDFALDSPGAREITKWKPLWVYIFSILHLTEPDKTFLWRKISSVWSVLKYLQECQEIDRFQVFHCLLKYSKRVRVTDKGWRLYTSSNNVFQVDLYVLIMN